MLTIVSLQVKPKPDMSDYLLSTFPQEMPERMHLAPAESQPPSRPQSTRPRPGTVGLSDVVGRASTAPSAAALPQPTAAAAAAQSNVGSAFGAGQTAADRQALQQALDMLPPTPSMQLLARSKHARPGSVMMQKDGLIKPGYVARLLVASLWLLLTAFAYLAAASVARQSTLRPTWTWGRQMTCWTLLTSSS